MKNFILSVFAVAMIFTQVGCSGNSGDGNPICGLSVNSGCTGPDPFDSTPGLSKLSPEEITEAIEIFVEVNRVEAIHNQIRIQSDLPSEGYEEPLPLEIEYLVAECIAQVVEIPIPGGEGYGAYVENEYINTSGCPFNLQSEQRNPTAIVGRDSMVSTSQPNISVSLEHSGFLSYTRVKSYSFSGNTRMSGTGTEDSSSFLATSNLDGRLNIEGYGEMESYARVGYTSQSNFTTDEFNTKSILKQALKVRGKWYEFRFDSVSSNDSSETQVYLNNELITEMIPDHLKKKIKMDFFKIKKN